jgi:hypothetical protein
MTKRLGNLPITQSTTGEIMDINDVTLENEVSNQSIKNAIGDEISLSQLTLTHRSATTDLPTKRHMTIIDVCKPGKQEFIRVHPEFSLKTVVLELKDERETYLVSQDLWNELGSELTPKIIYLTVNRDNVIKLWTIRLPDTEGRLDTWNQSALDGAEIAKKSWTRISSNMKAGLYEIHEAICELGEPSWPDKTFEEIINIAFKGRYINDINHPVLSKLRGEL